MLTDTHIETLTDSLKKNQTFTGPLILKKNKLSDLSCLYLKDALSQAGHCNISKLSLAKNPNLSYKAGVFIGQGLCNNPNHPIQKVNFKLIKLDEDGLLRIIEALNLNQNIHSAHLGIINDNQLKLLAKNLMNNKSLKKLKFQECWQHPWSDANKA